jgi:hypothetical protein
MFVDFINISIKLIKEFNDFSIGELVHICNLSNFYKSKTILVNYIFKAIFICNGKKFIEDRFIGSLLR